MPTLYVPVGIPGSGKSTYAKSLSGVEIISTDGIRSELTGSEENQTQNNRVFKVAHSRLVKALRDGKDVVFDATNLTRRSRADLLRKMPSGTRAVAILFHTPVDICLKQNQMRERHVPDSVILSMAKRLEEPTMEEFDEVVNI